MLKNAIGVLVSLILVSCGSYVSQATLSNSIWKSKCEPLLGTSSQIVVSFVGDRVSIERPRFAKPNCTEVTETKRYTYKYSVGESLGGVQFGRGQTFSDRKTEVRALDVTLERVGFERKGQKAVDLLSAQKLEQDGFNLILGLGGSDFYGFEDEMHTKKLFARPGVVSYGSIAIYEQPGRARQLFLSEFSTVKDERTSFFKENFPVLLEVKK